MEKFVGALCLIAGGILVTWVALAVAGFFVMLIGPIGIVLAIWLGWSLLRSWLSVK